MAFTIVSQGTFTQPATAVSQYIPVPSGADYFVTTNLTQMALAPATPVVVRAEWFGGGLTVTNDGLRWKKSASSSAITIDKFSTATASNGFTYYTAYPEPQAPLTGTTITNANPAVATVTNTYSNGDEVVIYNAVGMQQISGMTFTISSVSGSGFTLTGLNASAFATGATSFMVRRVSPFARVVPPFLYVTNVTQAAQAQVTVSQANMVYLGQKLEFTIPAPFGMVQLGNFYQPQNLPAVVTAIMDPYNFLINVNTTGFTPFVFPASTLSPGAQLPATVAPAGQSTQYNPVTMVQTGYDFAHLAFRTGQFTPTMYLPAGAQSPGGAAADVITWQAFKCETGTINAPIPS